MCGVGYYHWVPVSEVDQWLPSSEKEHMVMIELKPMQNFDSIAEALEARPPALKSWRIFCSDQFKTRRRNYLDHQMEKFYHVASWKGVYDSIFVAETWSNYMYEVVQDDCDIKLHIDMYVSCSVFEHIPEEERAGIISSFVEKLEYCVKYALGDAVDTKTTVLQSCDKESFMLRIIFDRIIVKPMSPTFRRFLRYLNTSMYLSSRKHQDEETKNVWQFLSTKVYPLPSRHSEPHYDSFLLLGNHERNKDAVLRPFDGTFKFNPEPYVPDFELFQQCCLSNLDEPRDQLHTIKDDWFKNPENSLQPSEREYWTNTFLNPSL